MPVLSLESKLSMIGGILLAGVTRDHLREVRLSFAGFEVVSIDWLSKYAFVFGNPLGQLNI